MEKLHHELWLTHAVNTVLGPLANAILRLLAPVLHLLKRPVPQGHDIIPDYLAMIIFITVVLTAFALVVRSRLSVENPGALQVLLEDFVGFFNTQLDDWVGPKGRPYLPFLASVFLLIWLSNLAGLVPGLMAPTSSLNVTLGCALTVWVFYHIEGVREQGLLSYLKHFAMPPGVPLALAPLMLLIEVISHCARVMSLSLRLFGNIFGEELVVLILASLVPFVIPLPIMVLGLLTGTLQALIFVILAMVYLGAAIAVEHDEEEHHSAA